MSLLVPELWILLSLLGSVDRTGMWAPEYAIADELMILTMDFVFWWIWSLVVVTGKLAVAWAFCTMLLAFCEHYVDDRFGAWFGVQLVVIELLFLWLSSFIAEAHSCKSLLVVGLCEFWATSWCWIILFSWIYKTLVWSLLLKRERDGFGDSFDVKHLSLLAFHFRNDVG